MISAGRAYVVLWVVTIAALAGVFAIAREERAGSPIGVPTVDPLISPNDDGELDTVRINLRPPVRRVLTVTVIERDGTRIRTIAKKRRFAAERSVELIWDGTDDDGKVVVDGSYRIRIRAHDLKRTFTMPTAVVVDTTPPRVGVATVDLSRVDSLGVVRIRVPVKDANDVWVTLDEARLVTNRIRPRRADLDGAPRTRIRISARLSGTSAAALRKNRDRLGFVAVDRAGNRAEPPAWRWQ